MHLLDAVQEYKTKETRNKHLYNPCQHSVDASEQKRTFPYKVKYLEKTHFLDLSPFVAVGIVRHLMCVCRNLKYKKLSMHFFNYSKKSFWKIYSTRMWQLIHQITRGIRKVLTAESEGWPGTKTDRKNLSLSHPGI